MEEKLTWKIDREYILFLVELFKGEYSEILKYLNDAYLYHTYDKRYKKEDFKERRNYITFIDDEFPLLLCDLEKPPFLLFYEGDISLLDIKNRYKYLAVVGSRNSTWYGNNFIENSFKTLNKDVVIVSGLARGIDSKSHEEALRNNLKTIAVLGTTLDNIYPKENYDLSRRIIENGGLILSEYPSNTEFNKDNFLRRNRIIASLSDSLFLVESYGRSGAMSTAQFALNLGKNIGCLPNLAGKESNCNLLIKDGAYLIEDSNDLYNLL